MLIPPNYDKLNYYENIRFEEKFFSSNKEKIKNEIKLYENWLLSILPSIIESNYNNEILCSLQNSDLLMDLIEKIDKRIKFKRSKIRTINKISNADGIIECLKYLNKKFNNKFKSVHYTDFLNGYRKKILSFLFLIKQSYETQVNNHDTVCFCVNIGKKEKIINNEFKQEEITNSLDVSDYDDLKESGFETESERLTDTEVSFDYEKKFDTTKNLIFEKNKYSIFKFLKIKKKFLLNEIKTNDQFNNLSIKNSIDYEDERKSKVDNLHLNNKVFKNKEIHQLIKINNNQRIESIQLFYREHDFIKIELDNIFPVFKLLDSRLDDVRAQQKVQVLMNVNFIDIQKFKDTDSNCKNFLEYNNDKEYSLKKINSNPSKVNKPIREFFNGLYETFYFMWLFYNNNSIV
jgi:hypothetical protein